MTVPRVDKPTTPGFYYWQADPLSGSPVVVVQLLEYIHPPKSLFAEALCEDEYTRARLVPSSNDPDKWGGRWWGPLPPPTTRDYKDGRSDMDTDQELILLREISESVSDYFFAKDDPDFTKFSGKSVEYYERIARQKMNAYAAEMQDY